MCAVCREHISRCSSAGFAGAIRFWGRYRRGPSRRRRACTAPPPNNHMWRIGIDVGGTFTDLAAVDETGRVVIAKCASTPRDQSEGLMEGLGLLAVECGTDLVGLLKSTERIVHGTTVATNALLERKGAKVGLLTTEGHRDVIEMREGLKDDRYNVRMPPPVPLVPRARRLGVRERVVADGRVTVPLAARSLATALETPARAWPRAAIAATCSSCSLTAASPPSGNQRVSPPAPCSRDPRAASPPAATPRGCSRKAASSRSTWAVPAPTSRCSSAASLR